MKFRRTPTTAGFPTADQQLANLIFPTAARQPENLFEPDAVTGPISILATGWSADSGMPSDAQVQEVLARVNYVQRNFPMPWPHDVGEQWAADRNWLAVRGIEPPPLPGPVQQVLDQVQNTIATAERPWTTETFLRVEADRRLLHQHGIPLPPLPHQVTEPPRPAVHPATDAPPAVMTVDWADRDSVVPAAAAAPDAWRQGCPICAADVW